MFTLKYSAFLIGVSFWIALLFVLMNPGRVVSENPDSLNAEFIGSEVCRECHADPELSEAGYNIWEESQKEAHLFALTLPDPNYPAGTNDNGVPLPPDGSSWKDYAYVMGGYKWKATYIRNDGTQLTGTTNAQYNLESGEWEAYHPGETLGFNVECARCHTTGIIAEGSWNGVGEDSLGTWTEIGVQCEGCHGPGSLHATRAFTTPEGETDVLKERCGDCHNNGGKKSPIPAVDGYVVNHAQYQELEASRHGEVSFFTCITCHEPHVALNYPDIIGNTFNGKQIDPIRKDCQECHPSRSANHPGPIQCIDCHMPAASKSAVSIEFENGGARGDVASHIWRINSEAVSRESMFTADGAFLKADASGRPSITLDFACLGCHKDPTETIFWASEYAKKIHSIAETSIETSELDQQKNTHLVTNYPNPFTESTTLILNLKQTENIKLRIFSSNGRFVAELASGDWPKGTHQVSWDGRTDSGIPVSSGTYVARLQTNNSSSTKTVLVVR